MRDVIVVGAAGGGAVIAKELPGRGLAVLLLEAGARFAGPPERDWSHFESDANNPASGYFRFGPADRTKAPWARDIATSMLMVRSNT